ncbi:MAG: alpha-isopropylmalate synthase regulatory domain-containing protein, partial [Xanthomonadales bacterium]|nr:alpha-isopropylmalate synthase regulatory domain-containing protein [Xanthomonadales bacterium]
KRLADLKKCVFDEDIEALVLGHQEGGPWTLDSVSIHTDIDADAQHAQASLKMRLRDHAPRIFSGQGDGPVNAIVNAMQHALGQPLQIEEFQVSSVSEGSDAQGRATVRARIGTETYKASGVSTDIVDAAAQALLHVINRHCQRSAQQQAQSPMVATA